MARSSARAAARPDKQKRRPFAASGVSKVHQTSDISTDSTSLARVQFLIARYGLAAQYATLLAGLAWEARHG